MSRATVNGATWASDDEDLDYVVCDMWRRYVYEEVFPDTYPSFWFEVEL